MTFTTGEVQAILDRLQAGNTIKAEAAQLGVSSTVLARVLEQVVGVQCYLSPPSKTFLDAAAPGEASRENRLDGESTP